MSFLEQSPGADVVQTVGHFPVIESVQLHPASTHWFRRPRRSLNDLPETNGESVLVFRTNERYELAPAGPNMLASDVVINATMVAVVATRAFEVPAVAVLPSVRRGIRLVLRASYNCRVTDPVEVLESGCWDASVDLRGYLLRDAKLRMLGTRIDAADNPEVGQRILARTLARNQLEPPTIPGMRIELVNVALSTQNDGTWLPPRQRHSAEYGRPRFGNRDRFGDDDTGVPRDGYGSASMDGDE